MCGDTELLCGNVRLFCGDAGLFFGDTGYHWETHTMAVEIMATCVETYFSFAEI